MSTIDIPFSPAFDGAAARARPTPLAELLERRAETPAPGWLEGRPGAGGPAAHRGSLAAQPAPDPEPEPAVEPEPAPEPPPPMPDPEMTRRMAEAIEQIGRARQELVKEPDVVELALAVAQGVLQKELSLRPEMIVEAVGAALTALRGDRPTRIRVHSDTLETLRAARPDLESEGVELVGDDTLALGGCIVEGARVAVDASVEERLERFRAAFSASLMEADHAGH